MNRRSLMPEAAVRGFNAPEQVFPGDPPAWTVACRAMLRAMAGTPGQTGRRKTMKPLLLLMMLLSLTGCSAPHSRSVPAGLEGRIWDVRAGAFITRQALEQRAAQSSYLMLGELHDSAEHHRLQLQMLQALQARATRAEATASAEGPAPRPVLAMEQFDTEHQAALQAAQAAGVRDAEQLADAGRLDRQGWAWPAYRDLVAHAGTHRWPLVATNLSRERARDIALGRSTPSLPAADAGQLAVLEDALVRGHCGHRLPAPQMARMVAAQRARDAHMAAALREARRQGQPVVFIAGMGHVRRDMGVPRYLADATQALVVGLVEIQAGLLAPGDYPLAGLDIAWFTAPTPRTDPCAGLPGGRPIPGSAQ